MTLTHHPVFIGSPLRRRSYALIVLGILAVLLGLALLTITRQFRLPDEALRVLLTALLATSALSLLPVLILRFLDRRERETWWVTLMAFLWGGLIATGLSLPLNTQILRSISDLLAGAPELLQTLGPRAPILIGAPIAGPLVEETMKALGVIVLFVLLRGEFDNMRDGFIYGALVGAGFTWFEAAIYIVSGFAQCGEAPWGLQLGSRFALFGLAGHALYTGLFGLFLGLARQTSARWLTIAAPVIGLLLAIGAHMVHNVLPLLFSLGSNEPTAEVVCAPAAPLLGSLISFSLMDLILFAPVLIIVLIGLWRSGIWERRVIRTELQTEAADIVTPDELAGVDRDHVFGSRRAAGPNRRVRSAIVSAQNEIAFRKHRVRRKGSDPDTDAAVQHWRTQIRTLRQMK